MTPDPALPASSTPAVRTSPRSSTATATAAAAAVATARPTASPKTTYRPRPVSAAVQRRLDDLTKRDKEAEAMARAAARTVKKEEARRVQRLEQELRAKASDLTLLEAETDGAMSKQKCVACGMGWPWAYFECRPDGRRELWRYRCMRCDKPVAEAYRWSLLLDEMYKCIRMVEGSPAEAHERVTSSSSTPSGSQLATAVAATALAHVPMQPAVSLPAFVKPRSAHTSIQHRGNAAKLPLGFNLAVSNPLYTSQSAPTATGWDQDLMQINEPERASLWLQRHYRLGNPSPPPAQVEVYRRYTQTFNQSGRRVLLGSDFVPLVTRVIAGTWMIPGIYALGGLEEIHGA